MRILFVCLGNICRSPTAEGVMRHKLREAGLAGVVDVESAGTGGWHIGHPPDERASSAARVRGIALESRAQRFVAEHADEFDLILAMDRENEADIRALAPGSEGKLHLLREFDPAAVEAGDLEVPDPYYGGDQGFEDVLDMVERACDGLVGEILRSRRAVNERALLDAAGRALGREVERAASVGGGDINRAWALELGGGGRAFLKSRAGAPDDEFGAEAAGLRWLAEPAGLPVPEVLAVIDEAEARGLVLEWVEPGRLGADGEEELGHGLATIHSAGAGRIDELPPGSPRERLRFGGVEVPVGDAQPANRDDSPATWPEVYARRLATLTRAARDREAITQRAAQTVHQVIDRLPDLAGPPEPPARVHGDLWGGNVLAGADGRPWLIDPAAHGAHREMDLAMLDLFGSVGGRTLAAYEEVWPLAAGREERVALWQLQPLLVHAILFGGSYGAAAERAAAGLYLSDTVAPWPT